MATTTSIRALLTSTEPVVLTTYTDDVRGFRAVRGSQSLSLPDGQVIRGVAVVNKGDLAAMRAVCALFRAQTADEQRARVTRHTNHRGFSQAHASVGTKLAEWMTAGMNDGQFRRRTGGKMKFRGEWMDRVEICRVIASHYAGQLAGIANSKAIRAAQAA